MEENTKEIVMQDSSEKQVDEPWNPVVDKSKLQDGEELEYDSTAYDMLHSMSTEWPCLSFDVLPDTLGFQRTKFPLTAYFVTGTQADHSNNNKLHVIKMCQLNKTGGVDSDEDEEALDDDPEVEFKSIPHPGSVNRIRCMTQEPHIVATWSDNSSVYLWDVSQHARALDAPPPGKLHTSPLQKLGGHKAEGFAMDWSLTKKGRLITGDCDSKIYLSEMRDNSKWEVDTTPFIGHKESVEDLQWSPSEPEVFASCSADKTIKIWDARMKKSAARSFIAGNQDINVISWNRKVLYLLVSGCDDGAIQVWDLRSIKETGSGGCNSVAHFKWHKSPITSVEWDPNDESVIGVSSEDDTVTIWDLSVEQDTEALKDQPEQDDIPAQLLFIHQGQTSVKEVHWHPQIPSVLTSTAEDGFNVFKPNLSEQTPDE